MKSIFLLLLVSFSTAFGQATGRNLAVSELQENQKAFLNLPEESRVKFSKLYAEAARLYEQKRLFEAFETAAEANKVFSSSSELYNLLGSCYVEIRAFDKASEAFAMALKISPQNPSVRFNVAEVLFVTKQWQKAHDQFSGILKEIPEDNIQLSRLVEFKILLCKSKLGMKDDVVIMAEKYDYQDDSPYYYFAKAAIAFEGGNLLEAEQWLARANRIFANPGMIAPWQDTLVEFGYIKSFYGSDGTGAE